MKCRRVRTKVNPTMKLPEIRQQIDILDEQILKLLNARAELVHKVGELKRAEGLEIYAPERE